MKVAVITGASSGLGREFALEVDRSENLDEIWLVARSREGLEKTASRLSTASRILPLDLARQESVEHIAGLLGSENARVSLLVNAAGFGKFGATDIIAKQDIADMIAVNVRALTMLSLAVIPFAGGGRIINMASVSGFLPLPYLNVYAATKAYVLRFSQALHEEMKTKGIRVTAVCPYWVDTNFIPVAQRSPGAQSISNFALMTKARPVVRRALRDSNSARATSFFGFASNAVHALSHIVPARLEMALWNIVRR